MTRFVRFVATRITKLLLNNRLPLRCTHINPKILSPGIILFKMKKYISTQLENIEIGIHCPLKLESGTLFWLMLIAVVYLSGWMFY